MELRRYCPGPRRLPPDLDPSSNSRLTDALNLGGTIRDKPKPQSRKALIGRDFSVADGIGQGPLTGFDPVVVTANGDELAPFLVHLRPDAAFAYRNGVEPEPQVPGHPGHAFEGKCRTRRSGACMRRLVRTRSRFVSEIFSLKTSRKRTAGSNRDTS
jgi:hypothetical protein